MTGDEITELSMQWLKHRYPELVAHYDDHVHWWPSFGQVSPGRPGFDPYDKDLVSAMEEMKTELACHFGEYTMYKDVGYDEAKAALGLETVDIPQVWKEGWG